MELDELQPTKPIYFKELIMSTNKHNKKELKPFKGDFTRQEPLPEAAIAAVVETMRSGRLHRYNPIPDGVSVTAELETAYAAWQGSQYCLACTSGGYAIATALRALGVQPNDVVLTNAFTLAPVPGAIQSVNGRAVLVEVNDELIIDIDDLAKKAKQHPGAVLLLSHMRGHLADMHSVMQIAEANNITVVEDCAHTMGATYDGIRSGNFGQIACFSTQTYKHLNSGEGGFLTTNDAELAARAVVMSGSYMMYERHGAAPSPDVFERIKLNTPNCSGRMDNARAAMLLPQLESLNANLTRWNERYAAMHAALQLSNRLVLPRSLEKAIRIGSSLQFRVPSLNAQRCRQFMADCQTHGVELKWFGDPNPVAFTSQHSSWQYVPAHALPATDRVLATLFDVRIPLTFSVDDCSHIGEIITQVAASLPSE